MPITYIDTPEKMKKLNKPHDDMWEYYPAGLKECIDDIGKIINYLLL